MPPDDTNSVYLALELRAEGTGLAGSLVDEHGVARPFSGWLGLLTLLEAERGRLEGPIESPA